MTRHPVAYESQKNVLTRGIRTRHAETMICSIIEQMPAYRTHAWIVSSAPADGQVLAGYFTGYLAFACALCRYAPWLLTRKRSVAPAVGKRQLTQNSGECLDEFDRLARAAP